MASSSQTPPPKPDAAVAPEPLGQDWKAAILADATLPEPVRKALLAGMPLERITLDADGRFWHEGDPIDNPRIAALFHRSIERTPGGTYVLHIPPFTYPIEVKDTPYFVTRVEVAGDGAHILLSDGTTEELDAQSLRYVAGRGFSCTVKRDSKNGPLSARFSRPAYYALADNIEETAAGFVLILGNTRTVIQQESKG